MPEVRKVQRINYTTAVKDDRGETRYSDWATDERDLFRQYDEIFTGWELVSKQNLTYTIRYTKIK